MTREGHLIGNCLMIAMIFLLSITIIGCRQDKAGSKPFPFGSYSCTGYDQAGRSIAKGSLSIIRSETYMGEERFWGKWKITQLIKMDGPNAYPSGSGDFICTTSNANAYSFDFNPNMMDGNYIFDAERKGDDLIGVLRFSGFAGGPVLGRFEALKNQAN